MTKAEAFGRWLARHPEMAQNIAWVLLVTLVVLSAFGIWYAFVGGKKLSLLIAATVAICAGLRIYRQAQKARSS